MQPAIKRGILSPCRRTARPPMNTMGQTALPGGIFLFCCLLAVLPAAANFSAAIASPTESPGYLASTTPQTPDYPADIPDFLQKLLSSDAQTRAAASRSLGTIFPEVKIPTLIQALSDPNWKIQVVAAYNLGQMGSNARSAIPALTAALDSPNPDVRFVVAKALGKIGSEAAVPALAQALQDKDENVRMAAAIALDNLGPDAQAALPVLQKTLRDGNWFVRTHAATAFVRLAARDKAMLPGLLQALRNPLWESSYGAEQGISPPETG